MTAQRRQHRQHRFDRLTRLLVVQALGLWAPAALARTSAKVPYCRGDVWTTAVRLLRVNSNLPIREKDEAAGYVLFDYLEGGKTYRASLELVGLSAAEPCVTDLAFSIPELPRRFEALLVERLQQKLRDERGVPVRPVPRPPGDRPAPDGGGGTSAARKGGGGQARGETAAAPGDRRTRRGTT